MEVSINVSRANGIIEPPPSKSLAHRYIICAGLADGKSVISNVDFSEDIKASLDCIMSLGAKVTIDGSTVTICGTGAALDSEHLDFYCRESGSTMRFFMGLAFLFGVPSDFYGSETLRNRPFSVYEEICSSQGIEFVKKDECIHINGKLNPGVFKIPGNISSQFISGLLFSLPLLNGDSEIELIPPIESRSYLDLTLQALNAFGIKVEWKNENVLSIKGNKQYEACDIRVEADYSNAAFLDAFNYIGSDVKVTGLNKNSLQGDRVYKEYFEKLCLGAETLDISDCPDLGPVLFAVAAANKGGKFAGTKRLKIKESDRGTVMCAELKKFGIESMQEENQIEIKSGPLKTPSEIIHGHNDHRIVMSLSLLLSLVGGRIDDAFAVRKSYPGFFDDIKKLGIEVD